MKCGAVFFRSLGHSLEQKRKYLAGRLQKIGFNILPAQGSYFLMADFRSAAVASMPALHLLCCEAAGLAFVRLRHQLPVLVKKHAVVMFESTFCKTHVGMQAAAVRRKH